MQSDARNRQSKTDPLIEHLLRDARKKLLETGTRNKLVHVNRGAKRAKSVAIINERSDDIFSLVRTRSNKMHFRPLIKEAADADDTELNLASLTPDLAPDDPRFTDKYLEVPHTPDRLSKKLLRLALDAKTAEEEQGINILYLALGFLNWYEDKASAVKREAPLILLPVQLVRNARTATYDLVSRDEDIVTNLPLKKRLMDDFGIELPEIEEEEEGWSPSRYFDQISEIISARSNWSVDRDGMMLGFFSFAKLLMLNDLDPSNWPEGALTSHPALSGLLSSSGFPEQDLLFAKDDRLDEKLEPADIIQVVDADASQTKVIEEVRSGKHLVVQGPPGTGKSQTITNIIAAAVHDGKKVLFVAEKMAALSVVHKRLVDVGLQDVCLELHSRTANKRSVIEELARTLKGGAATPNLPGPPVDLKKTRDSLNAIEKMLHTPVSGSDFTPYEALSSLVACSGKGLPVPVLQEEGLAHLSKTQIEQAVDDLEAYQRLVSNLGARADHPFCGVQNVSLQPTDLARLGARMREILTGLEKILRSVHGLNKGLQLELRYNFHDLSKLQALLSIIKNAPSSAVKYIRQLDGCLELDRLAQAASMAETWADSQTQAAEHFIDPMGAPKIGEARGELLAGEGSFLKRLMPKYKRACETLAGGLKDGLPKSPGARVELATLLLTAQTADHAMQTERPFLEQSLGSAWRGALTDFAEIRETADWLGALRSEASELSIEVLEGVLAKPEKVELFASYFDTALPAIRQKLERLMDILELRLVSAFNTAELDHVDLGSAYKRIKAMEGSIGSYTGWADLGRISNTLSKDGLGALLALVDDGQVSGGQIVDEFRYALAEVQWKKALSKRPQLVQLGNIDRHKLVERFCTLEMDRITDTRMQILAKYREQLPSGSAGEIGTIRGEIARKRGHMPLRRLMSRTGGMLQRIKPVFLMSPISVAQFLPPAEMEFDLLVMDEASQIRPEEALGSIARAKQIVVVGDTKQLPPTNFFSRVADGAEDDEELEEILEGDARATEMESILTLCDAKGVNQSMLSWHYRSRDPSLIRVSNAEFYDDGLILPPSPLEKDPRFGLTLTPVDGVYHSAASTAGRPRTNPIEAQAVVDAAASHARNFPKLSLGIVTFSVSQRNMITELLEHARRSDTVLDSLLREGKSENVFVKNIENVQGDERDVILISVGYGPNVAGGRLASMSFGPVNREGGERRLNVLFSRARTRCEVFASFAPGDIDLSRTSKVGPRVLKKFLSFAATGHLDIPVPTGADPDSPFEEDVASEIRKLGYDVDYQVGSGGFKIDLGVRNPDLADQYMLAVECDGATYHSALWARERDRLRQGVLEGLGWKFHRIWSTDWFQRRPQEIARLQKVLDETRAAASAGISIKGANYGTPQPESSEDKPAPEEPVQDKAIALQRAGPAVPLYKRSELRLNTQLEPHEVAPASLAKVVVRIVQDEGPLHQEEIARRVASSFGKSKAGKRIVDVTFQALDLCDGVDGYPISPVGEFWATASQWAEPPVRNRSEEQGATLAAGMLPPAEIRAAALLVERENGQTDADELIKAIANVFGFKRVGSDLRAAIERALDMKSVDSNGELEAEVVHLVDDCSATAP